MAQFTTAPCPACNQVGTLEVTKAQLDALTDGLSAYRVLDDRDKLIQDQAEFGIHPRCFLEKLESLNGDVSLYAGMGEL